MRRGPAYHGTLPGWKCPHNHSRPDLATACARREARRRQNAPLAWARTPGPARPQKPATPAKPMKPGKGIAIALAALSVLVLIIVSVATYHPSPSSDNGPAPAPAVSLPSGTPAAPAAGAAPADTSPATAAPAAGAGLQQIHDPGQVTGSLSGPCSDNGQDPDSSCTPGSIDPAVTQANISSTICSSGYTATVRPPEGQTEAFKYNEAYPAYSVASGTKTELDHLVPLELGGSNDATNLWPEVPPSPNPKDGVENDLNHAVCSHQVTLAAAQQAIASDWTTAESSLGIGQDPASGGGGGNQGSAPAGSGPGGSCRASASYNASYHDYDVYVHSDQPRTSATASASNGDSASWTTDGSGYADIYLHASPGDSITVTVGPDTCSTTAG